MIPLCLQIHIQSTLCSMMPDSHCLSLPNYQEDESLHRETLENLGHSRSAEKHVRTVFAK